MPTGNFNAVRVAAGISHSAWLSLSMMEATLVRPHFSAAMITSQVSMHSSINSPLVPGGLASQAEVSVLLAAAVVRSRSIFSSVAKCTSMRSRSSTPNLFFILSMALAQL